MDEVDFTILAAKSVFTDLIDRCPPAETCRDAFDRTAKATIKMVSSNGGFGGQGHVPRRQREHAATSYFPVSSTSVGNSRPHSRRNLSEGVPTHFELSLSDNLSSPNLSVRGEFGNQQSPRVQNSNALASDGYTTHQLNNKSVTSPLSGLLGHEGGPPIDPSLIATPTQLGPPPDLQAPGSTPSSHHHRQPSLQPQQETVDFSDMQGMDFLQGMDSSSMNGEMGRAVDQAQLDLGYSMNWDGWSSQYGDGQPMNPLGHFFFGGQQQQQQQQQQQGGNGTGHL